MNKEWKGQQDKQKKSDKKAVEIFERKSFVWFSDFCEYPGAYCLSLKCILFKRKINLLIHIKEVGSKKKKTEEISVSTIS